eukprot:XP_001706100.1 Hypothetical protein GL50803_36066 [Giardia lamblia ATCC 50803]
MELGKVYHDKGHGIRVVVHHRLIGYLKLSNGTQRLHSYRVHQFNCE